MIQGFDQIQEIYIRHIDPLALDNIQFRSTDTSCSRNRYRKRNLTELDHFVDTLIFLSKGESLDLFMILPTGIFVVIFL